MWYCDVCMPSRHQLQYMLPRRRVSRQITSTIMALPSSFHSAHIYLFLAYDSPHRRPRASVLIIAEYRKLLCARTQTSRWMIPILLICLLDTKVLKFLQRSLVTSKVSVNLGLFGRTFNHNIPTLATPSIEGLRKEPVWKGAGVPIDDFLSNSLPSALQSKLFLF